MPTGGSPRSHLPWRLPPTCLTARNESTRGSGPPTATAVARFTPWAFDVIWFAAARLLSAGSQTRAWTRSFAGYRHDRESQISSCDLPWRGAPRFDRGPFLFGGVPGKTGSGDRAVTSRRRQRHHGPSCEPEA